MDINKNNEVLSIDIYCYTTICKLIKSKAFHRYIQLPWSEKKF